MKNILLILLFIYPIVCLCQQQDKDSLETYLNIGVPQSSGLASADFKYYQIKNDSLFVLYKSAINLDTTTSNYELLASYPINKRALEELESLLKQTDAFGQHTVGSLALGWPRFSIYARYNGKEMDGYVANCYRKHIFVFIDWLNNIYPEENVIDYNKEELIKREKEDKFE